jgi:hypothetical protein
MIPSASPDAWPVTYIDTNSVEDDCMNVMPRSPPGLMAIDGK